MDSVRGDDFASRVMFGGWYALCYICVECVVVLCLCEGVWFEYVFCVIVGVLLLDAADLHVLMTRGYFIFLVRFAVSGYGIYGVWMLVVLVFLFL